MRGVGRGQVVLHGDGAERGRVYRRHGRVVLEVELLRGRRRGGSRRAQALVILHRVCEVYVQWLELDLVLVELGLLGELRRSLFDGGEAVAYVIHFHVFERVHVMHSREICPVEAVRP